MRRSDVLAVEFDVCAVPYDAVLGKKADDGVHRLGLSGAGLAYYSEHFAVIYLKRDVADSLHYALISDEICFKILNFQ